MPMASSRWNSAAATAPRILRRRYLRRCRRGARRTPPRSLPPCGGGLGRGVAATAALVAPPPLQLSPPRGERADCPRGAAPQEVVIPANAGIQYAAALRFHHERLGILDHPLSRVMTVESAARIRD